MFGFLSPVRSEVTDPLMSPTAAQSFWQTLPSNDAVAAQDALCKALAEPIARGRSTIDRLQAVLLLDQRSRHLIDALLSSDGGRPDAPSVGRSWQAAFDICRAFGRAYSQFLRLIRDNQEFAGQREPQSLVLLRLFRQRQLELLLRPFTDERAPAFGWKEIHDAYKFADAQKLLREPLPVKHNPEVSAVETRLEREYVHLLMQDLMNRGQFPPLEASWINKCIPRWCLAMALKPDEAQGDAYRFVVELDAEAALVRSNAESSDTALCLDMTPMLKAINAQIGSVRDGAARSAQDGSLGRARQLNLLQKVSALCATDRPVIERRAERRRTALTVEVVVGLPDILRRLRNEPEERVAAAPRPPASSDDVTISGFGPASTSTWIEGRNSEMQSPAGTAQHAQLTMVDESDNGCRLQGPALAANPTIPGALIAFREAGSLEPWTLAVIRRVKKRMAGRRVEIGTEYLGKNPHWVVVVAGASDPKGGKSSHAESRRFAGAYLPTAAGSPIKTFVLPACGLSAGDRLSVRSRTSVHTVRLKQPLEEQADFICVPFEIIDRRLKNERRSSAEASPELASQLS